MGEHLTLEEAMIRREALRQEGKTLVFTNGHFDLLHVGHLDYLEKARALGDALFIGLNDDASTEALKGPGRPIIAASERARLLAALIAINGVIIFEGNTAKEIILALKPDIYVKGGDYGARVDGELLLAKPLPEKEIVESYGGRIELIDYLPNRSTSNLIAKIKALPQ